MNKSLNNPYVIGAVLALLFIQAMFIFFDARKRGEKHFWLWGLFGLINVPSSLIIYLLVTRVIKRAGKF